MTSESGHANSQKFRIGHFWTSFETTLQLGPLGEDPVRRGPLLHVYLDPLEEP